MDKTLLICGDFHAKERLGYSEYIKDGREAEKKEIKDFILAQGKNCEGIVFLGDQFHLKNNPSSVIRDFVEFVEAFGDKQIYVIAGNHEKFGDGKSAIDFMREVKKPNWHIITSEVVVIDGMVFCPYFYKGELGVRSVKAATTKLMKMLPPGRILFAHHAVSDMKFNGQDTNILQEIVLPKKIVKEKYELTVFGHIHEPGQSGNVLQAGSVFNNEIGEEGKNVYRIRIGENVEEVETIKLPGRKIIKLENPSEKDLDGLKGSIVKIIFTKPVSRKKILELKEILPSKCDAYIIVERIPNKEREKVHEDSMMSMSIEDLLKIYAKEKEIDPEKLLTGFKLIQ